jgi:hypothetical protein
MESARRVLRLELRVRIFFKKLRIQIRKREWVLLFLEMRRNIFEIIYFNPSSPGLSALPTAGSRIEERGSLPIGRDKEERRNYE